MHYQAPSYGMHHYGTGAEPPLKSPFARSPMRFNLPAVCVSLFLPWILFCFTFWTMSFSIHFRSLLLCYFLVFLGLLLVLVLAKLAYDQSRAKLANPGRMSLSQNWFGFMALTAFIAWGAGVIFGDFNFLHNMEPFYNVAHLNQYPQIDPNVMKGQQIMDAGRVEFIKEAKLDRSKSMGFKNLDMYCVAPIVSGKKPPASYDFWAIGMNCCNGDETDFQCGEYNNLFAHSGLRLMRDDDREYFRLAVQQAESAFGIQAKHPLFFYWMQDPVTEVNAYMDDGFKNYLMGVFFFWAFQLFLVILAVVYFAKRGY